MIKAIVFDVDWVIVQSNQDKKKVITETLKQYNVYWLPWVQDILDLGLNRKPIFKKISEIHDFDADAALETMTQKSIIFESNPIPNLLVIDFIKNNSNNYMCFTNTALPGTSLDRVIAWSGMWEYFKKHLSFDDGTKTQNVEYVLNNYNLKPEEVLFIDDNINHINIVSKNTWVHTFHFNDYDLSIEDKILEINSL